MATRFAVVAVCVVALVVLFFLRKKTTIKKEIPRGAFIALILVGVVVAGLVDYWIVMRPPQTTGGDAPGMGGMGGMGGRMGGGMGGGMGQRAPSPRRELTGLVRKLAVLCKQTPKTFTAEQSAKLQPILCELRDSEKLPGNAAKTKDAAIRACLTAAQLDALAKVELPRLSFSRPSGGAAAAGGTPGAGAPRADSSGGQSRESRTQGFRDRMLKVPAVKKAYDAELAKDPTLADDSGKQSTFFRGIMGEMNPFQWGRGKEALDALLTALQDTGTKAPDAGGN